MPPLTPAAARFALVTGSPVDGPADVLSQLGLQAGEGAADPPRCDLPAEAPTDVGALLGAGYLPEALRDLLLAAGVRPLPPEPEVALADDERGCPDCEISRAALDAHNARWLRRLPLAEVHRRVRLPEAPDGADPLKLVGLARWVSTTLREVEAETARTMALPALEHRQLDAAALRAWRSAIEAGGCKETEISAVKDAAERASGMTGPALEAPLKIALVGTTERVAPLQLLLPALGPAEVRRRIERALDHAGR